MFHNLAAAVKANADAQAEESKFDAMAYVAAVEEHNELEAAAASEAALAKNVSRLIPALKEHGSTPSLMAFANADGSLTAAAGAAPVVALESMSDDARQADAEAVVVALEAFMDRFKQGKLKGLGERKEAFAAAVKQRASFLRGRTADDKRNAKLMNAERRAAGVTEKPEHTLASRAGEHKGAIAATAGIALLGAGAVYAIKKLVKASVAGTAKQAEEAAERAKVASDAMIKVASIAVPAEDTDAASAEFVAKLKAAVEHVHGINVDEDEASASSEAFIKATPTLFSRSGFTTENIKEIVADVKKAHDDHAEACEKTHKAAGEKPEGYHVGHALHHEVMVTLCKIVDKNLAVAHKIEVSASKHFTTVKPAEGEHAEGGEGEAE